VTRFSGLKKIRNTIHFNFHITVLPFALLNDREIAVGRVWNKGHVSGGLDHKRISISGHDG
jgi:hypothetical protein